MAQSWGTPRPRTTDRSSFSRFKCASNQKAGARGLSQRINTVCGSVCVCARVLGQLVCPLSVYTEGWYASFKSK
jgi:hypothetical protein